MSDIPSLFNLALQALERGQTAQAKALCRQVLIVAPGHAAAHYVMGTIALQAGLFDEAVVALENALRLQDNFVQAYNNLGNAHLKLKNFTKARENLVLALRHDPKSVAALCSLGNLCGEEGDFKAAKKYFKTAISLKPDHLVAHYNLGNAYFHLGQYEKACGSFERSLKLDPAFALAHFNLAQANERLGRFDKATSHYRQCLRRQPDFIDAQLALGHILVVQEKFDEALHGFREALLLNPNCEDARYFIAALEGGNAPRKPPDAYVKTLFDNYADRFEDHLVNELGYRVPELLLEAGKRHRVSLNDLNILDLGCGSGLAGPLFRAHAKRLVGVDLSPKMLAKAQAKNVYDDLIESEALSYLKAAREKFDVILAADFFIYVGDPQPIFESVRKVLNDDGLFLFSIETASAGAYLLQPSGRFAHGATHIKTLLADHGFAVLDSRETEIRKGRNAPISGVLFAVR